MNKFCFSKIPVSTDWNNKKLFPEQFFPQRELFDITHIFPIAEKV